MSIEKERKAFEDSMRKLAKNDEIKTDLNPKTGQYLYGVMEVMWDVWQASANREGYKLVPIKCTNNMAHAAKEVDGRLSAFKYGDVWEAMIGVCDDH